MERSTAEIKAAFAHTLKLLDDRVAALRPALEEAGIDITDRSNRSCFDRSGYPYCLWHLRFERRFPHGSEVALASAELQFLEPLEASTPRELVLSSVAEIFQVGKQSRIEERAEHRVPADAAGEVDFAEAVTRLFNEAVERLQASGVATAEVWPFRAPD